VDGFPPASGVLPDIVLSTASDGLQKPADVSCPFGRRLDQVEPCDRRVILVAQPRRGPGRGVCRESTADASSLSSRGCPKGMLAGDSPPCPWLSPVTSTPRNPRSSTLSARPHRQQCVSWLALSAQKARQSGVISRSNQFRSKTDQPKALAAIFRHSETSARSLL